MELDEEAKEFIRATMAAAEKIKAAEKVPEKNTYHISSADVVKLAEQRAYIEVPSPDGGFTYIENPSIKLADRLTKLLEIMVTLEVRKSE